MVTNPLYFTWRVEMRTLDLPAWAKLSAHRRKYEAVWEIQPRQYSMVWIHWLMNTSPISNWNKICRTIERLHDIHIVSAAPPRFSAGQKMKIFFDKKIRCKTLWNWELFNIHLGRGGEVVWGRVLNTLSDPFFFFKEGRKTGFTGRQLLRPKSHRLKVRRLA